MVVESLCLDRNYFSHQQKSTTQGSAFLKTAGFSVKKQEKKQQQKGHDEWRLRVLGVGLNAVLSQFKTPCIGPSQLSSKTSTVRPTRACF